MSGQEVVLRVQEVDRSVCFRESRPMPRIPFSGGEETRDVGEEMLRPHTQALVHVVQWAQNQKGGKTQERRLNRPKRNFASYNFRSNLILPSADRATGLLLTSVGIIRVPIPCRGMLTDKGSRLVPTALHQ